MVEEGRDHNAAIVCENKKDCQLSCGLCSVIDVQFSQVPDANNIVKKEIPSNEVRVSNDTPPEANVLQMTAAQIASGQLTFIGNVNEMGHPQSVYIMATAEDLTSIGGDLDGDSSRKSVTLEENGSCMYMVNLGAATISHEIDASQLVECVASPAKKAKSMRDPNDVTQSWFTSRTDKDLMTQKGACWRQGLWQKWEIELLEENINRYCERIGIVSPAEIIFNMSKDERKDFYRTVSVGLERPLFSVYRRVIRMYDSKNYIGKYSQNDMEHLKALHMKHGNDWATIGSLLGRSASSVKDKCRLMKDMNGGKWLLNEQNLLAEAVYKLAGAKPGDDVTTGLSWSAVAEHVRTRTAKQCRTKWLNYLNWKEKGGMDWTREADISLILKISNLGVENEIDIDWESLASNWLSARSPPWLRGKWWSLKRHVPNYQNLSLQEILAYLEEIHIKNIHMKDGISRHLGENANFDLVSLEGKVESVVTHSVINQCNEVIGDDQSAQYLITQNQQNPVICLPPHSVLSDHVIVHALPSSPTSAPSLKNHDNVTVQLTPMADYVSDPSDSMSLHAGSLRSHLQLASNGSTPSNTMVDDMVLCVGEQADLEHHISPDLVLVTSATTQFTNTCTILMSDPMMASNSSDLNEDRR